MQRNDYLWRALYFEDKTGILDNYQIRAFPMAYLIGPDGKLVLSPAPLPSEGFEQELSDELGTPLAGTHKKIKELEQSGLITPLDRMLTSYGKRVTRFRSLVRGFYVEFHNNELRVTLELDNEDMPLKLSWNPLLTN